MTALRFQTGGRHQTSPASLRGEAESLPVLKEEVEEAVHSLKAGKSPEVDNIPSELLKNGSEATTTVLIALCQNI